MTYIRKTQDEWQLWIDYGYGLEEVTAAQTWKEIKQYQKEYRENEGHLILSTKIKCKRIPLESGDL